MRKLIAGAKYFIKDLETNEVLNVQIIEINDVELTYKSLKDDSCHYKEIEQVSVLSIIDEEEAIKLNNSKVFSVKTDLIKAIISRSEVLKYSIDNFKDLNKDENTVLITISDPDMQEISIDIQKQFKDCLSIKFWDVEKDTSIGRFVPINKEQALIIKDFILKHKNSNFIINCEAGISRSAGVGYAVLCLLNFDGNKYEFSISDNPIRNHHRYSPNLTVYDTIVD